MKNVVVVKVQNESDDFGQVMTVIVRRSWAIYDSEPDPNDYPRDLVQGLADWANGATS